MYRLYETETLFWAEFSKPAEVQEGQGSKRERLPFKAIVAKARKIRLEINLREEEAARKAYPVDFVEVFSYRIGSEKKVYNTPEKIASRYRSLQGLPSLWEEDDVIDKN